MCDTGQSPAVISVAELDVGKTGHQICQLLYLESSNHFLIGFSNGEVHFVDGNFAEKPFYFAKIDSNFKLFYNLSRAAIVAFNDDLFGYRACCDNSYCLTTILDPPPGEHNDTLRLEIPSAEVVEWVALNSAFCGRSPEALNIIKQLESLKRFLNTIADACARDSTAVTEKRSIVVTLNYNENGTNRNLTIRGLVRDLAVMAKHLRKSNVDQLPTSLIFKLLERIMVRCFPEHPFHAKFTGIDYDASGRFYHNVCSLMLCSESARRLTFYRWPHPEYLRAYPGPMAETGFYHNPIKENRDRVLCFLCEVCLVIWEPGDDPVTEHQRHAPKCPFLEGTNHCNVARPVTMSGLGALRWAKGSDKLDQLIVGNASFNCDWLALSPNSRFDDDVLQIPEIRLYNLDGIGEMFHCIMIRTNTPKISGVMGISPSSMTNVYMNDWRPQEQRRPNSTVVKEAFVVNHTSSSSESVVPTMVTALATTNFDCTDNAKRTGRLFVLAAVGVDESCLNHGANNKVYSNEINQVGQTNSGTRFFHPFLLMYHIEEQRYKLKNTEKNNAKENMDVSDRMGQIDQEPTDNAMEICQTNGTELDFTESLNSTKDHNSAIILYDQRDMRIWNTQCIRLSATFDSPHYRVDHLVTSDVGCGFVVVGLNRVTSVLNGSECSSGVLVYRFASDRNTLNEHPTEFCFRFGALEQILVLPWNYFTDNSTFFCDKDTSANETICSVLMRFAGGIVVLADPNNGQFIRILEDKNVVSLELSQLGAFAALTRDGKLMAFEIQSPTSSSQIDTAEGKAISLVSILHSEFEGDSFDDYLKAALQIQDENSVDSNILKSFIYQPLNFSLLSDIWTLIRANTPAISSKPVTGLSKIQLKFSSIFTLHSNLQIHAPLNWLNVDSPGVEMIGEDNNWKFYPGNSEEQKTSDAKSSDVTKTKSAIFQLLFLPSIPLSHVNIAVKFNESIQGCPDMQMSILRFQDGISLRDFLNDKIAGSDIKVGENLSEYRLRLALLKGSENLKLLKENTRTVVGPLHMKDFCVSENTYMCQVGSSALYTGICEDPKVDGSDWMAHRQRFYILFESISNQSAEQRLWERVDEVSLSSARSRSSAVKRSKSGERMDSNNASNGKKAQKECADSIRNLIESVSFAAYTCDSKVPQDKLERILLLWSSRMPNQILRLAAGLLPAEELSGLTQSRYILAKNQALDVLIWLLESWRISSSKQLVLSLEKELKALLKEILYNGFLLTPSRTISQKWTTLFSEFLDLLKQMNPQSLDDFVALLLGEAARLIPHLHQFEKSSGLIWFFTMLTNVLRIIIPLSDRIFAQPSISFLEQLIDNLNNIGKEWKTRWDSSFHSQLAKTHELFGLVFEQTLFDYPTQVLLIRSKTHDNSPMTAAGKQSSKNGSTDPMTNKFSFSVNKPMVTVSSDPIEDFGDGYTDMWPKPKKPTTLYSNAPGNALDQKYFFYMHPPNSFEGPYTNLQNIPMAGISATTASAFATKLAGFPLDEASTSAATFSAIQPNIPEHYLNKMEAAVQFASANAGTSNQDNTSPDPNEFKAKYQLERSAFATVTFLREHAIDEVTWLKMSKCQWEKIGSAAAKLSKTFNAKSWDPTGVMWTGNIEHKTCQRSKEPLKNSPFPGCGVDTKKVICSSEETPGLLEMESLGFALVYASEPVSCTDSETGETFHYPYSSAYPKNDKALPAQTDKSANTSSPNIKSKDDGDLSSTSDSSSSGGIPVPKNAESSKSDELVASSAQGDRNLDKMLERLSELGSTMSKSSMNLSARPSVKNNSAAENSLFRHFIGVSAVDCIPNPFVLPTAEHFKSPDILALNIERMTAASKTIVLDFGDVVLLTDLMIPACEYLKEISVDCFCVGGKDIIRLLSSTQICHKCLTLTDIQLPVFARYVAITFSARRLYDFPCFIPMPQFFGTRFYSWWQAYSAANYNRLHRDIRRKLSLRFNCEQYQWEKLERLHELAVETQQMYEQTTKSLRRLLQMSLPINSVYETCIQHKLKWNRIMFAIQRLERDLQPVSANAHNARDSFISPHFELDANLERSLRSCSADQLRFTALSVLSFATRAAVYINFGTCALQPSYSVTAHLSSAMSLDVAVQYFDYFCYETISQLQAQCCSWLFQIGSMSSWWSDFFPTILREFFHDDTKTMDNVFYLLSYLCCESMIFPNLQRSITQTLLEFLVEQLEEKKSSDKPNITLLSWTLMLISSIFDVITPIRKKRDRWAFLTGDFSTDDCLQQQISDYSSGFANRFAIGKKLPQGSVLNTLVMTKNYKKLCDDLQQMQPSLFESSNLAKIKEHVKSVEAAYDELSGIIGAKSIMTNKSAPKGFINDSPFAGEFGGTGDNELLDLPSTLGIGTFPITVGQKKMSALQPPGKLPAKYMKTRHLASASADNRSKMSSGGRYYSVHLKLAPELCVRVLRLIVKLWGKKFVRLPVTTQLVAFKVISKISIHGSSNSLPFSSVFGDDLQTILQHSLIENNHKWIRHALLQMLLDLTDAEVSAHQKKVLSEVLTTTQTSTTQSAKPTDPFSPPKCSGAKRRKETEEDTEDESFTAPAQSIDEGKIDVAVMSDAMDGGGEMAGVSLSVSDKVADAVINEISMEDAARAAAESLVDRKSDDGLFVLADLIPLKFDIGRYLDYSSVFLNPSNMHSISASGAMQCGNLTTGARIRRLALLYCDTLSHIIASRPTPMWTASRQIIASSKQKFVPNPELDPTISDLPTAFVKTSPTSFVTEIVDILHTFIQQLDDKSRVSGVAKRILEFYWFYHSSVSGILTKTSNILNNYDDLTQFKIPILSLDRLNRLISFAVKYAHMDEVMWSQIFRIIDYTLLKVADFGTLSCQFVELELFQPFMERFCRDSLNKFDILSAGSSYGPVPCEAFSHFLDRLFKQPSTALLSKIITTLCNILSKDLYDYPLDVLLEISSILVANVRKCMKFCDTQLMSRLYLVLMELSSEYISMVLKKDPRTSENTNTLEARKVNFCFTMLHMVPFASDNDVSLSALFKQQGKKSPTKSTKTSAQVMSGTGETAQPPPLPLPPVEPLKAVPKHLRGRTHQSKYETIICNLMRTICATMISKADLCVETVENYSSAISTAMDILCQSRSDEVTLQIALMNFWEPVSLPDMVLYGLLCLLRGVESNKHCQQLLIRAILYRLQHSGNGMLPNVEPMDVENADTPPENVRPLDLTMPAAVLLGMIVLRESPRTVFNELDGHLFVSKQVENFADSLLDYWPPKKQTSFTPMTRQLHAMSGQISGKGGSSSIFHPLPVPATLGNSYGRNDMVESINFSPYCVATSSSMCSKNLQPLLSFTGSHRRSRNMWTYNYSADQDWLDITLTLPYPIILHEIVVKPYVYSSLGLKVPSFIQVEVCSNEAWSVLNCPRLVSEMQRIAISADLYQNVVSAVRLYLKRPTESGSISLSHIAVMGSHISELDCTVDHAKQQTNFLHWMGLMNCLSVLEPSPWIYAPELPKKLMSIFLGHQNPTNIYEQLQQFFFNVDYISRDPRMSIIRLIITYINDGKPILESAYNFVVMLLYRFCRANSSRKVLSNAVKVETDVDLARTRLRQLLYGVLDLLDYTHDWCDPVNSHKAMNSALVMWSAACALWQNSTNVTLREEASITAQNVGPKIMECLTEVALIDGLSRPLNRLKYAAGGLLCSMVCATPKFLSGVIDVCRVNPMALRASSRCVAELLGRVCQSASAVSILLKNRFVDDCLKRALLICKKFSAEHVWSDDFYVSMRELIAILVFLDGICTINVAVDYLAREGGEFFEKMLHFVLSTCSYYTQYGRFARKSYSKKTLYYNLTSQLRRIFIQLSMKCLSCDFGHRKAFAELLSKQLSDRTAQCSSPTLDMSALDEELIYMVDKLVVEDEKIMIHFSEVVLVNKEILTEATSCDDWLHPLFGANHEDYILDVSLYTKLKELTPVINTAVPEEPAKKSYEAGINSDDLDEDFENVTFNTEITMFPNYMAQAASTSSAPNAGDVANVNKPDYKVFLYCEHDSKPVDPSWTVHKLVDGLRNKHVHAQMYRPSSGVIDKATVSKSPSRFSDGYFMLNMKLQDPEERAYGNTMKYLLNFGIYDSVKELSTFDLFARAGGLFQLSYYLNAHQIRKNLQFYYDQGNKTVNRLPGARRKNVSNTTPIGRFVNVTRQLGENLNKFDGILKATANREKADDKMEVEESPMQKEPTTTDGSQSDAETSDGYLFNLYTGDDPINTLNEHNAEEDALSGSSVSSSAHCGDAFNLDKLFVAQYVTAALGVFLQLDDYGQLFVGLDRECAKRLLRLSFNREVVNESYTDFINNLRPSNYDFKSHANVSDVFIPEVPTKNVPFAYDMDMESVGSAKVPETLTIGKELYLYPFIVLMKLLQYYSPDVVGLENAMNMRKKAISLGVFDIVLRYLSHFTRQVAKFGTSRASSQTDQPEIVKTIDIILESSEMVETLRQAYQSINQEKCRSNVPPANAFVSAFGQTMAEGGTLIGAVNPGPNTAFTGMNSTSTSSSNSGDYWAKGTGFGSGTTHQVWNMNEHLAKQRQEEEIIMYLLKVLQAAILPEMPTEDLKSISQILSLDGHYEPVGRTNTGVHVDNMEINVELISLIQRSCLCATLRSYLMNDSVLDLSKHIEICQTVVSLVLTIMRVPPMRINSAEFPEFFTDLPLTVTSTDIDIFTFIWNDNEERRSLFTQLTNLQHQIDYYLDRLSKAVKTEAANPPSFVKPSTSAAGENKTEDDEVNPNDEDGLAQLSKLCQQVSEKIAERLGLHHDSVWDSAIPSTSRDVTKQGDFEKIYCDAIRPFQFDSIQFYQEEGKLRVNFHYSGSLTGSGASGTLQQSRRLAKEAVALTSSLPLASSSTVFVRTCEERLDAMKVLITGPAGTPYSNGCFEFDVYFPPEFPNVPVDIHFETTGNRRVRFNPNLYDDGKVCLSILNTWRGRPEERWNANTSTLLQVLVSIQSLIFVKEPYFNEPGFERYRDSPSGIAASRDYNANICNNTVRWAMLDMLKNPPIAFKDVIQRHFWLKRGEICEEVTSWIAEMQAEVDKSSFNDNPTKPPLMQHLACLKNNFKLLKKEFEKMTAPEGLEQFASFYAVSPSTPDAPPASEPGSAEKMV